MTRKHSANRPIKFSAILLCLAFVLSIMALPVSAADRTGSAGAAFRYEHDPRLNARAMADIVVDPTAVYGFAPSPEGSLSSYASFDWSDPELVNGENGRLARIAYHESINEMYAMMNAMRIDGKSIEEIARAVSSKRNEIRLASYADDPEGLAVAKARNMEKYGHEEGPLPDELYKQYGSWETVLEKAFSTNSGMDACLGLYDDYYELYVMAGQVEDEHTAAASREYAVAAFVDAAGIFLPDGTDALSVFTDAETSSTYYTPELAAAVEKGILNGYSDHTLRPQNTISRVEAMVLLSRCLPELGKTSDAISFTDVPAWAKRDIDRLSAAGLVLGYGDGTLGASDDLTVEQVKILAARISEADTASHALELWTDDAPAKIALTAYMAAITDPGSEDFIPVLDRIAVFDLDGTLFCETDPNYFDYTLLMYRVLEDPAYKDKASDFEKEVANKIKEQNETGKSFSGLEVDHGKAVASAFAGMTVEEFNAYIQEFKKQPMPSYDGMLRGEGWYLPMLEIVDYLKANDFTIYIVSGTDRLIVRGIADHSPIALPNRQIIGSDELIISTGQGDTDGLDYVFKDGDELILGGEFLIKNLKMNKVSVIMQEIGQQPVLSFGNSTGDSSMAEYVTYNNRYKSLAFMLCCDDTVRENGSETKAQKMLELCEEFDWIPISMKNDWTTIYGAGVTHK
ncbi:MAG: S-layer homology domain-containing protein [Oscillospiraceae bacterium]|nr:S-layer homology domain-containing protein [Oscillospiraceae bacterium]